MNKNEFLELLSKKLSRLSTEDAAERLNFYNEMIDDRIEEGLSEEDAVSGVGSIDEIASQIISEKPTKNKKKRKFKTWELVLLILGAPVWFSLICAAFAVCISLYASLWVVVISLWAVFVFFVIATPAAIILGIRSVFVGSAASGLAIISAALVFAGLAILTFIGCMVLTKTTIRLTKTSFRYMFRKKEDAQ